MCRFRGGASLESSVSLPKKSFSNKWNCPFTKKEQVFLKALHKIKRVINRARPREALIQHYSTVGLTDQNKIFRFFNLCTYRGRG